MTDQETKEKLAKAVGFRPMLRNKSWPELWETPDGKNEIKLPDFLNDMNACLKLVKPKLKERGLTEIVFDYTGGSIICDLCFGIEEYSGAGDIEPRAFCLAALKYFEEANNAQS
jgi:hypothetical protein